MYVLVTGGAGFIGGHLAEAFLRDGHDVTVLDNLEPFYDVRLKEHTLDVHREVASEHAGAYTFREGDVRDAETVREVVADTDVVVHRAAQAGVRTSVTEPRKVIDINVGGVGDAFGGRQRGRRRARDPRELVVGVRGTGVATVRGALSHGAGESVWGDEAVLR